MTRRFYYARFTSKGEEQLGSDSYLPLDRRLGLDRVLQSCREQRHRLRFVKPWYDGVNLYDRPLSVHQDQPHSHHSL